MKRANRIAMSAVGAVGACAGVASGQLIAHDGFNYPVGGPLTVVGVGGTGWVGQWNPAAPGDWTIDSMGSTYSSGGVSLLTGGRRLIGSSAAVQRTMAVSPPLGDAPRTVWVSFLAQQHAGSAAVNWLGVKLPCRAAAGVNSFLFLGKPYNKPFWGTDAGSIALHRQSAVPTTTRAFIVARLDLRPGADDVHVWINPGLSSPPSTAAADLALLGYGNFEGITKVVTEVGGPGIVGDVDEVRVGGEFLDVAPTRRGLLFRGSQHQPLGEAILENTSPDMLTIGNLGGTGNDGDHIALDALGGAGVSLRPDGLAPGGHLRVAAFNWNGQSIGATTWRRTPSGDHQLSCDYSGVPGILVTSVRISVYDGAGNIIHDETTPGSTATAPINAAVGNGGNGGLCSDGRPPRWYLDEVFDPFAGRVVTMSVFGCPNDIPIRNFRNCVTVNANFAPCPDCQPGVGGTVGTGTIDITSSGVGLLELAASAVDVNGARASGLGGAILSQACADGQACADPSTRRLLVDGIGGTGQDGVEFLFDDPQTTGASFALGGLSTLAPGTGRVAAAYDLGTLSGDRRRVTVLLDRAADGRLRASLDTADAAEADIAVTVSNDGAVVGTAQGSCRTIHVYVDGMLQYVTESSFLAWIFINNFAYGISPPPGTPDPTFTIEDANGAQAYVGDALDFVLLGGDPIVSVQAATLTARDLSGVLSISDLAMLRGSACPADFNQDGFLDFFDYDGFVGGFEQGDPATDFNRDGFLDFFDYADFVGAFEVGC